MLGLPWGDWQFWATTALAVVAAWLVLRPWLARRKPGAAPGCPGCNTCAAKEPETPKLVKLGR
ncbi:MAG TPA: hypothetical protein VF017_09135 [Thermoanaerobaculia bacterium]|nr:hypothetical protein [Thermoanaerobaculia bacterium]